MEIVNVEPEGDMVLLCGKDEGVKRLRVCSRALSRASPFFKAILSERWEEGADLKAHGSVEIPLKDDDPAALTTICHGLHFCHDQIDLNISLADLTTVADLADKYELGAALRPIAELWITKRLENMQEADYHDLLVAAHLLRHERMFETVAERMVWDASGAGFETALDKSVQDSPEIINLFHALYRQRKEAVTTIMSLVEHIVDNDLYLGLEPVAFCAMGHQCTYVQRRV